MSDYPRPYEKTKDPLALALLDLSCSKEWGFCWGTSQVLSMDEVFNERALLPMLVWPVYKSLSHGVSYHKSSCLAAAARKVACEIDKLPRNFGVIDLKSLYLNWNKNSEWSDFYQTLSSISAILEDKISKKRWMFCIQGTLMSTEEMCAGDGLLAIFCLALSLRSSLI